jgi:hypothetical protein
MTDRVLKGVVANFLGTYLSRYSDYQGYWVFGFLVPTLSEWHVDLLRPAADDRSSFQAATELAVGRFREQVQKSQIDLKQVAGAELVLVRDGTGVTLEVNGKPTTGWAVLASIAVESNRGRKFGAQQRILVAPHNPAAELRSTRAA